MNNALAKSKTPFNPWLSLFAKILSLSTFVLIFIGGLVTSTGSGLAVPDWPNTYGHFMFAFPLSKMVGGILYEHGHRMVATVVGALTLILAIWTWRANTQRWLKWLALSALLAVITQGVLGGLTVLFLLPTPISVLHGCLAQAFLMMTVAIAVFTSKEWTQAKPSVTPPVHSNIQTITLATTFAVYAQLIIGATMRHMGAGLAIPDFPLAFGSVFPPIESQAVAIHFLHRLGGVFVACFIAWTAIHIFKNHGNEKRLTRPAVMLVLALLLQLILAALTIWTQKAVLPTTAHVATGAFILGTSLFLTLRTHLIPVAEISASGRHFVPQTPVI